MSQAGTYHHSGDVAIMRVPLAVLAAFIHRLGPDEPAAAIADYAERRKP